MIFSSSICSCSPLMSSRPWSRSHSGSVRSLRGEERYLEVFIELFFIAITSLTTLLILSSLSRGEREIKSNHYQESGGCIYSLELPAVRGGAQQREGGGVGVVQRALGPALPEQSNDNTADIIPSLSPLTADNIQNLSPFIALILFKPPVQPGSRLGVLNGGLCAGVGVWQSVACNR